MTALTNGTAKLRIALVSTQKDWHGGESQLALLAEGLRYRGHDCLLLARRGGAFGERMRKRLFTVEEFGDQVRSPHAVWKIRRVLRDFSPQVIHANDAHALSSSGIASVGLGVPIRVAARRVDFPLRYSGRYRYFADGLICVSTAVQKICHASGMPAEKLFLVHDGVEPRFAESGDRRMGRESLGLSRQQALLLVIAKLTDHKGHAYLLRAIPELCQRFPHAVFALAGDGELRGQLEALTDELKIHPHVRFLGYRSDVPDLLAAADVVVQPSHLEGLCSSLIDAMLAKKPIVATRAGGIPDLVRHHPWERPLAWLAQPKSSESLVASITEALKAPDERRLRGERARRRALRNFTATAMVDKTLSVYEMIRQAKLRSQAASLSSSPALSTV